MYYDSQGNIADSKIILNKEKNNNGKKRNFTIWC